MARNCFGDKGKTLDVDFKQFPQERLPNNEVWTNVPEIQMMLKRLLPTIATVAILSACASGGGGSGEGRPPAVTVASAMAAADAAVLAGQPDKAYKALRAAAAAFPTDKTPWLRMAQMHYDAKSYGEAIVNAHEVLERDPDDTLANSIAAVSGLRVSSKALADLTQKNNLSGNVRTEAQDLAKLLRSTLGEDVLVQTARGKRETPKARTAPAPTAAPPAHAKPAASSDPFGALK
jgi:tetratricopeptide (TPR) repeat protein